MFSKQPDFFSNSGNTQLSLIVRGENGSQIMNLAVECKFLAAYGVMCHMGTRASFFRGSCDIYTSSLTPLSKYANPFFGSR